MQMAENCRNMRSEINHEPFILEFPNSFLELNLDLNDRFGTPTPVTPTVSPSPAAAP